ncbi:MAG: 30S ribosomal protein S20 [Acidobacteriota bacterium]
MANSQSAIKRIRQSGIRRLNNRSSRSRMRTIIKRFRHLVEQQELGEAREKLPQVYAVIDRTSQKGLIHANTAARYKSRLTKLLNTAGPTSS